MRMLVIGSMIAAMAACASGPAIEQVPLTRDGWIVVTRPSTVIGVGSILQLDGREQNLFDTMAVEHIPGVSVSPEFVRGIVGTQTDTLVLGPLRVVNRDTTRMDITVAGGEYSHYVVPGRALRGIAVEAERRIDSSGEEGEIYVVVTEVLASRKLNFTIRWRDAEGRIVRIGGTDDALFDVSLPESVRYDRRTELTDTASMIMDLTTDQEFPVLWRIDTLRVGPGGVDDTQRRMGLGVGVSSVAVDGSHRVSLNGVYESLFSSGDVLTLLGTASLPNPVDEGFEELLYRPDLSGLGFRARYDKRLWSDLRRGPALGLGLSLGLAQWQENGLKLGTGVIGGDLAFSYTWPISVSSHLRVEALGGPRFLVGGFGGGGPRAGDRFDLFENEAKLYYVAAVGLAGVGSLGSAEVDWFLQPATLVRSEVDGDWQPGIGLGVTVVRRLGRLPR